MAKPTKKKSAAKKTTSAKSKATSKSKAVTKKKAAAKKTSAAKAPVKKRVTAAAEAQPDAGLEMFASRQFTGWLAENKLSLAFTTYQAGKLFLVGLQPNNRLSIFERTFNRCMGLHLAGDSLYMSSLYQLWRFENVLEAGQAYDGYDRVFVPLSGHTTSDLDIHDIAVDDDGRVIFVNTLFSCLSTLGEKHSFTPLWQPNFVSKLAAEDRCHLNGLAMDNGRAKYVTAVAATDVTDGWRSKREAGGVLIDVASNEIVAEGLSMPHSPRVHEDKTYLLNSGHGQLGTVDTASGAFEEIAFCPGYLRGLSFHKNFAIVGLSKPRNKTFAGLPLDGALGDKNAEPQCAIYVIDLRTGDIVHWLRLDGIISELYDVVVLPNAIRPMAMGFVSDEISRTVSVSDPGTL